VLFYRGARTNAIYEIPETGVAALEAELFVTADRVAVSPMYGKTPRTSMWSRSSLPTWGTEPEDSEPGLEDEELGGDHHYEQQSTPAPSSEDDAASMYASSSVDAAQYVDWGMED